MERHDGADRPKEDSCVRRWKVGVMARTPKTIPEKRRLYLK